MAFFSLADLLRSMRQDRVSDGPVVEADDGSVVMAARPFTGTNAGDVLLGSDRNDKYNAKGGDDLLYDSAGSDRMNGGKGYDAAIFSGSRSEYVIERVGKKIEVTRNGETDQLKNIEELRFEGDGESSPETFVVADGGFFDEPAPSAASGGGGGSGGSRAAWQNIRGTNDDDVLGAGDGNDRISGKNGDDLILDSAGSDNVNGGRGHDTAFYAGDLSEYTIQFVGNRIQISNGTDTDRLTSIEELLFGVSPDDAGATSYLVTRNGLVEQVPAGAEPEPEPGPSPSPPPPPPPPAPEPEPEPPVGQDTPGSLDAFEAEVLRLVNEYRAANGLGPLQSDSRLNAAADDWSETMAEGDFFRHSTPAQVEEQGYEWRNWGENIAAGQTTPESVVNAWINSPGHRANILNENYQDIGIGYYYLEDDTGSLNYHHYWTQAFGTEFGDAIA